MAAAEKSMAAAEATTEESTGVALEDLCAACDASIDAEPCAICISNDNQPGLTHCGHPFCAPCLQAYVVGKSRDGLLCPLCKQALSAGAAAPPASSAGGS